MKPVRHLPCLLSIVLIGVFLLACNRQEEGGDILQFHPPDGDPMVLTSEVMNEGVTRFLEQREALEGVLGRQPGNVRDDQLKAIRVEVARNWLAARVDTNLERMVAENITDEAVNQTLELLHGIAFINVTEENADALERYLKAQRGIFEFDDPMEAVSWYEEEIAPIRDKIPTMMILEPESIPDLWANRSLIGSQWEDLSLDRLRESNRQVARTMLTHLFVAASSLKEQDLWDEDALIRKATEFRDWDPIQQEHGEKPEFPNLVRALFLDREYELIRARMKRDHTSALNRAGREIIREIHEKAEWEITSRELGMIHWWEKSGTYVLPRLYPLLELAP